MSLFRRGGGKADWLVVGDPPDEDEDRLGQPFVEQAGVLLDNMLKAVGASRGGAARTGAHLAAIRAAHEGEFFSESMFARFVPCSLTGSWRGRHYG